MKQLASALILALISLSFMAPASEAQPVCTLANGHFWCYNNGTCGQPCNDVCAAANTQPIASDAEWFEAQNSEEECREISRGFGLGDAVYVGSYAHGCVEDSPGFHTADGGAIGPILCSNLANCPASLRVNMDQLGVPCGDNSRRAICPCDLDPVITLSPPSGEGSVQTDHTVTATVISDGVPIGGLLITFDVTSGPNAGLTSIPDDGECFPNDNCTTDANGQVSWTYSSAQLGTDVIAASLDGVAESNAVQQTWTALPIPTLSEWGLIAAAAALGIAALMVIRRRRAAA